MKKLLGFIIGSIPLMLFAQQENFTVKGKIGTLNDPAKIYLSYRQGDEVKRDSAILKDGRFEFKNAINEPVKATLILYPEGKRDPKATTVDALGLYLEKGSIQVTSSDSLSKAKITGSALNKDNQKLTLALKPVTEERMQLSSLYRSKSDEERKSEAFMNDYNAKQKAITAKQKKVLADFIKENSNTIVSIDALQMYGGAIPSLEDVQPLYNALSGDVRNTTRGKEYGSMLEKISLTAIGKDAPDFVQNDPNGVPVKLSSFRGKYVLVDFWASWCGPCRAENPNVVKAYNNYKDKNFTVLGVSLDQPNGKEKWLKAIEDDKLTWSHVSDLAYWKNAVAQQYGVQAIPQNFLIDPNGKIIAKNVRGETLDTKLSEVIK